MLLTGLITESLNVNCVLMHTVCTKKGKCQATVTSKQINSQTARHFPHLTQFKMLLNILSKKY